MLEKTIKADVRKRLKELGAYQYWPVPMGLGATTVDVLGVCKGIGFGIECKRPGGALTPGQTIALEKIKKAGGRVWVIDNRQDAANINF